MYLSTPFFFHFVLEKSHLQVTILHSKLITLDERMWSPNSAALLHKSGSDTRELECRHEPHAVLLIYICDFE